jgi:thiol-disulfide isomerase/thioredoxin
MRLAAIFLVKEHAMSNWKLIAAIGCIAALTGAEPGNAKSESDLKIGTKVGQRLPHFKTDVWDITGEEPKKAAFDSHETDSHVAYVFMSRTCPYCNLYEARLAKMENTYAKKGIRFVMVYPTRSTPVARKIDYHKSAKFGASLINDKDASIAKALSVKKTPEIVLVSKKGEIVFRGGIDDNPRAAKDVRKPYLMNACDDLAAGKRVRVTSAPLYG